MPSTGGSRDVVSLRPGGQLIPVVLVGEEREERESAVWRPGEVPVNVVALALEL